MKKFIIILVSISILFLTGCEKKYDMYQLPEGAYFNAKNTELEVFKEYNLYNMIGDTNMELISSDKRIDTDIIGEYTETVELKYDNKKYKYDLKYTIKDVIAPSFIQASSYRSTTLTTVINPCESIVFADDYDSKPTCRIDGDIDFTTLGTYHAKYVISDSSGNENTKDLTVYVLKEIPKNNSQPTQREYINIENVISDYKNSNTMIGIDVSRWQGNVDWQAVKDAGVEFVIMRIGVQTEPEETLDIDSKFNEYFTKAKEVGLKVSVYVYNTATSKEAGIKTAQFVLNTLNGAKLDLPIAYDWENWSKFMNYNISLHTLKESYNGFRETIENAGYESMLYSSKYYLEHAWIDLDKDTIWLAHYTNNTDYKGKYYIWQMGDTGKVPGITDNTVDIDILYKN